MIHIGSIIPSHNRRELTLACVEKLLKIKNEGFHHTIYVVDDGSNDGTGAALNKRFANRVIVLKGTGDLFWTGAINLGAKEAVKDGCDCIHLMNDDIEFELDFLQELYNEYKRQDNAIIGSVTCSTSDRSEVVRGGVLLTQKKHTPWVEIKNKPLKHGMFQKSYSVDAVSGRSVLIPAVWFEKVGYFDQKHFPHAFADFEFFFRIRKQGGLIFVNPVSIIYTKIEPKFMYCLIRPPMLKALFDLWFDNKYFGITTQWHMSKFAAYRYHYLAYIFLQKIKWTLLTLICEKKRLLNKLEKYRA